MSASFGLFLLKRPEKKKSVLKFESVFGVRPKTSQHRCNNCFLVRCKALLGFSPHLAFLRLPLRAGAEVSSRGVMLAHSLGHISFSPRLQRSAKALSTHTHHGGLLLRSGGRLRREVIVGSDSGGRCQASFRTRSLRSSCCIFYRRNKRTARYFHTRAISLRAAAKETRWGQESVEGKQNSSFRNPKWLNTTVCCSFSLSWFLGSKSASDESAAEPPANSSSRQISE